MCNTCWWWYLWEIVAPWNLNGSPWSPVLVPFWACLLEKKMNIFHCLIMKWIVSGKEPINIKLSSAPAFPLLKLYLLNIHKTKWTPPPPPPPMISPNAPQNQTPLLTEQHHTSLISSKIVSGFYVPIIRVWTTKTLLQYLVCPHKKVVFIENSSKVYAIICSKYIIYVLFLLCITQRTC